MNKLILSIAFLLSVFVLNNTVYALKFDVPDEVIPVVASGDFKGKVTSTIDNDEESIAKVKVDVGYVDGGFKQIGNRRKVLIFEDITDDPATPENETSTLYTEFIVAYKGTNAALKAFLALHAPDFPTKGN